MRATCLSKTAGFLSVPSLAAFSSSWSGSVPHRKNDSRDARSTSVMRYVSFAVVRRLLDAEHEARVREDALDAEADAVFEVAAVGARLRVEVEQVVEVVAHGAAVRLRGEPPQDVGRARDAPGSATSGGR